jgi:hypothetical protein
MRCFRASMLLALAARLFGQAGFAPDVPRVWDADALKDWATPVAALKIPPTFHTAAEYYRAPVDNLRTYPVYCPDREPAGYWRMLQSVGPLPLIEPAKLQTQRDWINAGQRVFRELDFLGSRTFDAAMIGKARSKRDLDASGSKPLADGTIYGLRWVVTPRGVALATSECAGCHSRLRSDTDRLDGPGFNNDAPSFIGDFLPPGDSSVPLTDDPPPLARFRSFGVPWLKGDIHAAIKTMDDKQWNLLFDSASGHGMAARWNGSVYYPTKIADLIGVKDRKYFDHTGTHKHRGIADLMRYAALVAYADSGDFGPYHMFTAAQRKIPSACPMKRSLRSRSISTRSSRRPIQMSLTPVRSRAKGFSSADALDAIRRRSIPITS